MKFFSGCVLCLALTLTGCVEMPLWKESKPIAPAPAAKPKPMLPPITADEIDETNGRAKAEALWEELDREEQDNQSSVAAPRATQKPSGGGRQSQ